MGKYDHDDDPVIHKMFQMYMHIQLWLFTYVDIICVHSLMYFLTRMFINLLTKNLPEPLAKHSISCLCSSKNERWDDWVCWSLNWCIAEIMNDYKLSVTVKWPISKSSVSLISLYVTIFVLCEVVHQFVDTQLFKF